MTTGTHEGSPTYLFGRRDRGGLLLGFRAPQLLLFGLGAIGVLVGFVTAGGQGGVAGLLVAVGCTFVAVFEVQGRPLVDWARPLANYGYQRATGGDRYLGGQMALHRARHIPRLDLPGLAQPLRVHQATTPCGPVAVLKLRDRWTVVLQVRCGNYVLADRATQERRVTAWGALLAQCGQEGSRVAGIQWLERTIPDTGTGLADWWTQAGDPSAAYANAYTELIAAAGPTATRHELYLAVSFDTHRIGRLIRQAGGGPDGAAVVVLAELAWVRQALARADLEVLGEVGPHELARLVRTQYDPAALTPAAGDHLTGWRAESRAPVTAGPMAAHASWSTYRTDTGWHAVYWIAEWPAIPVQAAWCYPLLALSGVRRTITVTATPIPPSRSLRELRSARVAKRADAAQRRRLGQIETAADDDEAAALERREAELVRGHTEYRFTGWVTVTADTSEHLDAACALVEQAAVRSAVTVRRVYGEVDQAFTIAALPLNQGVRT